MKPIAVAWHMVIAGALVVPLLADGSLVPILAPDYSYQSGNYGRAYDAVVRASHIALGADGTLYFLDGMVIRKVAPDRVWCATVPIACGRANYGASRSRPEQRVCP